VFREHWKHARHCENERLWFTNIYAIVVAAILVFIGNAVYGNNAQCNPADFKLAVLLAIFGLILSVIGFQIVIALSLGYLHHITDIAMIYYYSDNMEFYRHPKKPVRFGTGHRRFFQSTIALFGALSILYIRQDTLQDATQPEPSLIYWALPALLWIIISVTIEVGYQCTWKGYSIDCVRFMKALQRDFEGKYRREWKYWFDHPSFL